MKLKGKPKKARLIGGLLFLAALLSLGVVVLFDLPEAVMIAFIVLGFALLIAGAFVFILFWRCSYCGRMLPSQGMLGMEHCPYCGFEIEDSAES